MRYIYKLSNIDCASCGLKIEDKVSRLEGVFEAKFDFIFLNLYVTFDQNLITDKEIEDCIHKSLKGVKIVKKNNKEFLDNYQEESIFIKILKKRKELKKINNN